MLNRADDPLAKTSMLAVEARGRWSSGIGRGGSRHEARQAGWRATRWNSKTGS